MATSMRDRHCDASALDAVLAVCHLVT